MQPDCRRFCSSSAAAAASSFPSAPGLSSARLPFALFERVEFADAIAFERGSPSRERDARRDDAPEDPSSRRARALPSRRHRILVLVPVIIVVLLLLV